VGVYGERAGGEHVKVWINGVVVECDEGMRPWVGHGSGKMGVVVGTKPELKAVRAVGQEGVSLIMSWSWRTVGV
jgi:hypothetical protein